jgi:hypothetical protein
VVLTVTHNWANRQQQQAKRAVHSFGSDNYYHLLGLTSSASASDIRRAYRELSKRYHPDTSELPIEIAKEKFQKVKEAYATLNDPQQRGIYDRQLQARHWQQLYRPPVSRDWGRSHGGGGDRPRPSSAYLDPTDRPLSAGELFALFILGITFLGCLLLAIAIGLTRGEIALEPTSAPTAIEHSIERGSSSDPAIARSRPSP